MKNLLFLVLAILCRVTCNSQELNTIRIASTVNSAATNFMDNPARVGLSVGVLVNGQTHTYHYGTTNKGTDQVPTDQTLYEIGSITKTMAGTLLAQAAVDKKLSLEDDIRKYLPGQYPNLEYEGNSVKLVHLLNHSSGLPFMLPDTRDLFHDPDNDSLPFILNAIERNYTKQQFYEDLKRIKIDTIPGIKLSYSNAAAHILGHILESVYEKPFEELVLQYITHPLGMRDTRLNLSPENAKNLAKGYNSKRQEMPYSHNNISGAAGGFFSTIPDMLKYAKFHMDEKNPVIKLSHQPTWGDIQYYAIGLNWQMQDRKDEYRRIFQSGGTAGFNSFLVMYPELNLAISLFSNEADENSQGALSEVAQRIMAGLLSK